MIPFRSSCACFCVYLINIIDDVTAAILIEKNVAQEQAKFDMIVISEYPNELLGSRIVILRHKYLAKITVEKKNTLKSEVTWI